MGNVQACEDKAGLGNGPMTGDLSPEGFPLPRMRRNLSWTLAGNSAYTACQWGMLVAMAKLGTPEMVGVFGLALAITAPIVMFADLELRSVQATDAKREYRFGHYLGLRLITSSAALLVIVGVATIAFGLSDTAFIVIAMGAAKAVESVSDVLYGLFQNRERMDRIAISMVIKGVFALSALSAAVYLTRSAFWSIVALGVAWAIVLVTYDMPSARRVLATDPRMDDRDTLRPRWTPSTLRRLAWISLPLGCAMMMVSLNLNIPRYFVQWHLGERQLGFFVAVAYLMVAVSTVVNALGQAACPRLARYHGSGDLRAFRLLLAKLAGSIIVLSGIGVLAALFAGREILTILYRPEYASGSDVFVWLMVASGVGGVGVILRYGCISARRFAAQLPLWIVIVATNALMCLMLIPKYGLKGAGIAMTLSAAVQVAGNFLILSGASGTQEHRCRRESLVSREKTSRGRLGVVVPGCLDSNKGDQALIWETIETIQAAGVVDEIAIVGAADAFDECEQQTRALGHRILPNMLRHPRRGRNRPEDRVRDSLVSLILMIAHSLKDFSRGTLFLLAAPQPRIARLLLSNEQRETYAALVEARAVFVKGGGFIHAYGGFTAPYLVWYLLFYIRLAHRLGKPVLVLPNSFGPFDGLAVRRQVKKALAGCAFVCARESISAQALADLLGREVPVFPDLGYFLHPASRETGLEICRRFGVPVGQKPCVAFTVRPYRFPGSTNPSVLYDQYIDALAGLVRHVASLGYHPVFITQVRGPSAHENDELAIRDLLSRLDVTEYSWVDWSGNCRDLKAVYGCMDYVVGTRFHSVVFAQGLEVPSMAIAYGGNKAVGIMGDIGLSEYVIPIERVTAEALCSVFDHLSAHADDVRSVLRKWLSDAAPKRDRLVKALRDSVECFPGESLTSRSGKET